MSLLENFKNKKILPVTVAVKVPKENPELEIIFNRVSSMEMKYILSQSFDGGELNNIAFMLKTFEKLVKDKLKSFTVLNNDLVLSKKDVTDLLLDMPIEDVIDCVSSYNAGLDVEVKND